MYDYHDYLRATHPASSPWWAWPFDLKPVWFAQFDYANGTTAVIYDTGNVVIFWLAIPAVAWAAWQAWQRRSLALTFIAIAIMSLWLPWARIDRATFQYHVFTALPFSFLALAYFLAELWHGPSPPTWLLARASAALALIGAPLLWLLRLPLCGLARTEQVNAGTEVCGALSRDLTLTDIQVVGLLLAVGGLGLAGALFYARFSARAAAPDEQVDGRPVDARPARARGPVRDGPAGTIRPGAAGRHDRHPRRRSAGHVPSSRPLSWPRSRRSSPCCCSRCRPTSCCAPSTRAVS